MSLGIERWPIRVKRFIDTNKMVKRNDNNDKKRKTRKKTNESRKRKRRHAMMIPSFLSFFLSFFLSLWALSVARLWPRVPRRRRRSFHLGFRLDVARERKKQRNDDGREGSTSLHEEPRDAPRFPGQRSRRAVNSALVDRVIVTDPPFPMAVYRVETR